jgi:hypothetical protein
MAPVLRIAGTRYAAIGRGAAERSVEVREVVAQDRHGNRGREDKSDGHENVVPHRAHLQAPGGEAT